MIKMFSNGRRLEQLESDLLAAKTEIAELRNSGETFSITDVDRMSELFSVPKSVAGVPVSVNASMKVSIVYACTRLICGAIGQMPLKDYRKAGAGREEANHQYGYLLNTQPTPAFTAHTFWEYMYSNVLLGGDGFAPILRNRKGDAEELLPVPYSAVEVQKRGNRLIYFVTLDGKVYAFDQDDMLHIPGFGFNGLRSMSVIRWGAANSIGLEIAMEQYAGDFFENGAHQSVALIKKGKWGQDQKDAMRDSWSKTYGGIKNKRYPLVFDDTVDIKNISISAKDSQLLEMRDFQITDIARAFGIPSFMVNQEQKTTSFGSGVETIGIGFLRYTLSPHTNRGQQEVTRKLFGRSGIYAEFETGGLLRGTHKERNDAFREAVGGSQGPGWMSINEVRKLQNLPAIDHPLFDMPYHPAMVQNNSLTPEGGTDEAGTTEN